MSTLTEKQFNCFLSSLAIKHGEKVLDLGCGLGKIAYEVAARTGADLLAVDRAPELVFDACLAFGGNVSYQEMDFDHIPWVGRMFDVIYSVDALHTSTHLETLVRKLYQLLVNGGRFGAFWDQTIPHQGEQWRLEPDQTDLGHALHKLGLPVDARDFTEDGREFWLRAEAALQDLEDAFHQEGRGAFYKSLRERAARLSLMYREGRVRRYFYLVHKDVH